MNHHGELVEPPTDDAVRRAAVGAGTERHDVVHQPAQAQRQREAILEQAPQLIGIAEGLGETHQRPQLCALDPRVDDGP
jgi:hypothetical protein